MRTIYKYVISTTNELVYGVSNSKVIRLPKDSKILTCDTQNDNICIWVELDTSLESDTEYYIQLVGTGWNMDKLPGFDNYIGTVKLMNDSFIYHAYYKIIKYL